MASAIKSWPHTIWGWVTIWWFVQKVQEIRTSLWQICCWHFISFHFGTYDVSACVMSLKLFYGQNSQVKCKCVVSIMKLWTFHCPCFQVKCNHMVSSVKTFMLLSKVWSHSPEYFKSVMPMFLSRVKLHCLYNRVTITLESVL